MTVTLVPGGGIGPEVATAAVRVLATTGLVGGRAGTTRIAEAIASRV